MASYVSHAGLGPRLRTLRKSSRLTPRALEKRAGLDRGVVASIESGARRPSAAVLGAVARVLRVKVRELAAAPRGARAGPLLVRAPKGGLAGIARAIAALPTHTGDKLEAAGGAAVLHALAHCSGNRSAAARMLGMERKAFVRRVQRALREESRRKRRRV